MGVYYSAVCLDCRVAVDLGKKDSPRYKLPTFLAAHHDHEVVTVNDQTDYDEKDQLLRECQWVEGAMVDEECAMTRDEASRFISRHYFPPREEK